MSDWQIPLRRADGHWSAAFTAMSCPCEVLVDDCPEQRARVVVDLAVNEARRVEQKFSRYRQDNVVHAINTAEGRPIEVDPETARLIDFAASLTEATEGAFDITSGVLRRAWRFDGGNQVPDAATVQALLSQVGWHRVQWDRSGLRMEPGMQIDLGGIGKEYAVDCAVRLIADAQPGLGALVNLGGDLAACGVRGANRPWSVGIESAERASEAVTTIALWTGGMATSGDARRFVMHGARRLSHILDARTGWPVEGAPRSITVQARTCTEAGALTTLASMKGCQAGEFLVKADARYWLQ